MPSMSESMKDYIQLSLNSLAIAVINGIKREDLFYISINPSKEIWTETRKFNIKPLGPKLNQHLEDNYQKYLKKDHENKFDIDKQRVIDFFLFEKERR